jgi:cysteine-rich repeat protein
MILLTAQRLSAVFLPATLAFAGACNVFDASLYEAAEDAGPEQENIRLADQCTGDVPVVVSKNVRRATSTIGLDDTFSNDIAACTGSPEPGNDGFFQVDMVEGEKWHFHLRLKDFGSNPAIYVMNSCDERACSDRTGLDECGTGRDEHLSFRATTTGAHIIGVDSRSSGGADYEIEVVNPICGNGLPLEHSESCDDGNDEDGDGCASDCRAEVGDDGSEVEPNDESTNANLAQPEDAVGSVRVHGDLGGRCDFDMWAVDVPEGGSIRATMLSSNGDPCADGGTEFLMKLYLRDGFRVAGAGRKRGANNCPSIDDSDAFAADLDGGRYFVRVTTAEDVAAAEGYLLQLEVVAP